MSVTWSNAKSGISAVFKHARGNCLWIGALLIELPNRHTHELSVKGDPSHLTPRHETMWRRSPCQHTDLGMRLCSNNKLIISTEDIFHFGSSTIFRGRELSTPPNPRGNIFHLRDLKLLNNRAFFPRPVRHFPSFWRRGVGKEAWKVRNLNPLSIWSGSCFTAHLYKSSKWSTLSNIFDYSFVTFLSFHLQSAIENVFFSLYYFD